MRCPSCGATYPNGAGFCPADGVSLVDETPAPGQSGRMVGGAAAAWHPAPPSGQKTADALDGRTGPQYDEEGEERLLGQTLAERYRIDDRLGSGGMGLVYRATHVTIDKAVAVKVLRAEYAEVEDVAERFEMEARVASKISHPNVVTISDYGHTPMGSPYYVMELLDGLSLADLIDHHGPVDVKRAIVIARQLASGLAAAHALGVVHRDLKPDNVILVSGPDGEIAKILDFGIARVKTRTTRLTAAGSVVGTPEYMSPEQAQGKEVDSRSDIYSVGVILFELLCGSVPIRGTTLVETLTKQVYDPAPSLASMDARFATPQYEELTALLDRILSKDANERPPTCEALVAELDALLSPSEPTQRDDSGFKATVAMGSWSVGDLPEALSVGAPATGRQGPQLSQGAPAAVGWEVTPPTPVVVPAAPVQESPPPAGPAPSATGAGGQFQAGQAPPVAAAPGPAGMPVAIPAGYTRRPTSSMRRSDRTHWGVMMVVGVLGSIGAALGVIALFQIFGGGVVPQPSASPASQEQTVADGKLPEPEVAEQTGLAAVDPGQVPDAEPDPRPSSEEAVADAQKPAEMGAPAASGEAAADSAIPKPPKTKKKSTKKSKKSNKKLDRLPEPSPAPADSKPATDPPPIPSKPPEAGSDTDPPPDPGVSLGDLRDPFG